MRPAMTSVFEAYLVPIIIALVIGVVIAWWAFGRKSDTRTIGDSHRPSETSEAPPVAQPKTPTPKPTTRRPDGTEGYSLVEQAAAGEQRVGRRDLREERQGAVRGDGGQRVQKGG